MPFRAGVFQENVRRLVPGTLKDRLLEACREYGALTTPQQRARSIQGMMAVLDRDVDGETGRAIMEACGRTCISAGTLAKAQRLQREADDLDDLLRRLNEAHIGGGHLRRQENAIYAAYDRCYCGSVSRTREALSATYCACSYGWYRELFETLCNGPVEVELLTSIIQGDDRCEFVIRISDRA